MPYIDEEARHRVMVDGPNTSGELNYTLTNVINNYVFRKGLSYQTLNDVMGALDGAAREFYRRMVAPYEDQKKEQNGDVYWVD